MATRGPGSADRSAGPGGESRPCARRLLGGGAAEGPAALAHLFDVEPESWLRAVPGRGTFRWPPPSAGQPGGIVKRFRGDAWRERLYELLRGRRRGPARREFENLVALAAAGVRVPPALGWAARSGRSLVAMEYVPHTETLREHVARAGPADTRALLEHLLAVVVRLHEGGWYHRDLYLQHFLVVGPAAGDEPALCLIDVGRARREASPRSRWFAKDLGALLASTPAAVPRATRLRFLAAYLDARGIRGRSRRRRWARRIEARRRSIAGHAPRHGEVGDPPPETLP